MTNILGMDEEDMSAITSAIEAARAPLNPYSDLPHYCYRACADDSHGGGPHYARVVLWADAYVQVQVQGAA